MVEQLEKDMITAMKEKDKDTLTVIRMVKAAMDQEHIDRKREINDELLIDVVNKQIKMRKDSIAEFDKAGRTDLSEKTQSEVDVLMAYLPEQLSLEEVSKIIDESFYMKTFLQNQILGKCLLNAKMTLDDKVIYSYIDMATMKANNAVPSDLDGVIDQLRVTEGVEVAILLHETSEGEYKISMRSNNDVNVSEIAVSYGGGGHIKAAGCSIKGDINTIVGNLVEKISNQL